MKAEIQPDYIFLCK